MGLRPLALAVVVEVPETKVGAGGRGQSEGMLKELPRVQVLELMLLGV